MPESVSAQNPKLDLIPEPDWLNGTTAKRMKVGADEETCTYIGGGNHQEDHGWVQSKNPVPRDKLCYYFEISLDNIMRDYVTIGFAHKIDSKSNRQLGLTPESIGYDIGNQRLLQNEKNVESMDTSLENEIDQQKLCLGCGIILESNTVFFTANGKEQEHLSVIHSFKLAGDIYPTITMHNRKSKVGSNFGSAPFMFDILAKVRNCMSINEARADSVAFNSCDTIPIIKEYLACQGYLEAFEKIKETDSCSGIDSQMSIRTASKEHGSVILKSKENVASLPDMLCSQSIENFSKDTMLEVRDQIRKLILKGQPLEALKIIDQNSPTIKIDEDSRLQLHIQEFVEFVKRKDYNGAAKYLNSELSKLAKRNSESMKTLTPYLGLLVCKYADDSSVPDALKPDARMLVANKINGAIIKSLSGFSHDSRLSQCITSLQATNNVKRLILQGPGCPFDWETEVNLKGNQYPL